MMQAKEQITAPLSSMSRQDPLCADAGGAGENEQGAGKLAGVSGALFGRMNGIDAAVPFLLMCILFGLFALAVPNYLSVGNLQQLMRDFAEPSMVALAMGIVIFGGGIDLSVGATFAIANFVALYLFKIEALPLGVAVMGVLAAGAVIGALNGVLIAYVKTRPFLTTLAMLLVLRAGHDLVTLAHTVELANAWRETDTWNFLGAGFVWGIPTNMAALIVLALALHVVLTRMRFGLHIMATGADRKAARHAGIDTRRVTLSIYILSGMLASLAGLFYAARQSSAGSDTGLGWEVTALAAVVLGGVSLAGGRGSVGRVLMGSAILFLLMSGLLRMNMPGGASSALTGFTLLVAVAAHIQWSRWRDRQRAIGARKSSSATLPADIADEREQP